MNDKALINTLIQAFFIYQVLQLIYIICTLIIN